MKNPRKVDEVIGMRARLLVDKRCDDGVNIIHKGTVVLIINWFGRGTVKTATCKECGHYHVARDVEHYELEEV